MNIGGFQPFSLSDFPGHVAAIVFTQGCNFRCPYCHNPSLLPTAPPGGLLAPENDVMGYLHNRAGQLDGVVVTGGEPTIQPDLPNFLRRVKALGLATKLDTNGSRPEMLRRLITDGLVDFVAMDIKAPFEKYRDLAGVAVDVDAIKRSMEILAAEGIAHVFRTTVIESLLSRNDVETVRGVAPNGAMHHIQMGRVSRCPTGVRRQSSSMFRA